MTKHCHRNVNNGIDDSDLVSMRYSAYGVTSKPLPVASTWQRSSKKQPPAHTLQDPTGAKQLKRLQEVNDPAESTAIDFDDEWSRQFLFLVHGSLNVENPIPEAAHRLCVKESGQTRPPSPCINGNR
jgi:hypothetical protein